MNITLNEATLDITICQVSTGVWSSITNMTATAIISHKAWLVLRIVDSRVFLQLTHYILRCHRKIIREGLRNTLDKRSKAERILALLIESGLLYCVSGVSTAIICTAFFTCSS